MFGRMIDDFKDPTGTALRLTSLAAAAAVALVVTPSFLGAAAFVFVLEKYGPVQACLTGAVIFFVVTMIAAICYMVRKNQIKVRAEQAAKSTAQTLLAAPMLVAAGIQVVRAIGVKKLIPILAVGGLALGLMMSRGAAGTNASEAPAEELRHCERSEAIHSFFAFPCAVTWIPSRALTCCDMDCFASPGMTVDIVLPSRGAMRPEFCKNL